MNITFVASEVTPYAKVGGLADVVGSLPKALRKQGHQVECLVPKYGKLKLDGVPLVQVTPSVTVSHEGKTYPFTVYETHLPNSDVPVDFFENKELFPDGEGPYPPNQPEREIRQYEVFGKAVLEWLKARKKAVDVLHLNDWHTANLAYLLKKEPQNHGFLKDTGTVLSIHNTCYQGANANRNWLAEGIQNSDALVAVSPNYGKEILTPQEGFGMEGLLNARKNDLSGIINGLDTELFNPATDHFIPTRYTVQDYKAGKAAAKAHIQQQLGLPVRPDVPLIGMVTRLVEQKGLDLLLPVLDELAKKDVQIVILGNGEPRYEDAIRAMNTKSNNIRSMIGFNMALGQQIYAGSDAFLMPSRFEPCGLSQLIALRYGSLPIARRTGGLADTVIDATQPNGNGFVFDDYTPQAMVTAIDRAADAWRTNRPQWDKMIETGMQTDFSWDASARAYEALYKKVAPKAVTSQVPNG